MRGRSSLFALLIAAALSWSWAARAADPGADARARAEARFAEAEEARAGGRFEEARRGYQEALEIDPAAPSARSARARWEDLEAHAEGGFVPLAKLEAVRRDPAKIRDRAAIEALEQDLQGFPAGRVRSEAALVVAEAWWRRLKDPRRAIAPLTFAVEDSAADRLTRALALNELAAVRRELGELGAALEVADRYPDLAPATRAELRRLHRRDEIRAASIAVLAILAAVGIASLVRLSRRLGGVREAQRAVARPLSIAASLYLGGAAALLVRRHGDGDPRPFLWLGLGVLAIDLIARTWRLASGDARAPARAARAAACAAGVIAAAFLAVERTNAGYLESFGL